MITIVTAPGRSGTSLTMQMLQAAGVPLMWNRLPNRTEINPFGHYELDRHVWDDEYARDILPQCEGKAVKIFRSNLAFLTPDHDYQFITIHRDPVCVRDSQIVMLKSEHRQREIRDDAAHLTSVEGTQEWLDRFLAFKRHLRIDFSHLQQGWACDFIAEFMGLGRNGIAAAKMRDCIDTKLWHFKSNTMGASNG